MPFNKEALEKLIEILGSQRELERLSKEIPCIKPLSQTGISDNKKLNKIPTATTIDSYYQIAKYLGLDLEFYLKP